MLMFNHLVAPIILTDYFTQTNWINDKHFKRLNQWKHGDSNRQTDCKQVHLFDFNYKRDVTTNNSSVQWVSTKNKYYSFNKHCKIPKKYNCLPWVQPYLRKIVSPKLMVLAAYKYDFHLCLYATIIFKKPFTFQKTIYDRNSIENRNKIHKFTKIHLLA